MLVEETIYKLWNSFGIPAYEENSVPSTAKFPYISYQLLTGEYGADSQLTASLWYREPTLKNIALKKDEISDFIGYGGIKLPCKNGYLWINKADNFASYLGDPNDQMVKRIVLSINVRFYVGGY